MNENGAGDGKKSAKCWASHPSGPHPSGPHISGPHTECPLSSLPPPRIIIRFLIVIDYGFKKKIGLSDRRLTALPPQNSAFEKLA